MGRSKKGASNGHVRRFLNVFSAKRMRSVGWTQLIFGHKRDRNPDPAPQYNVGNAPLSAEDRQGGGVPPGMQ